MRESLAAGKRARSFAAKEHKPRSRDRGWRKGHTESRDNATGSDYIDVSPRFNVRGIVLLFSPHHASLSSLLSSLFLLSATAASVCAYKAGIVGATLWLRVFPPLSSLLSFRHRRIPLSRVPLLSLSLSFSNAHIRIFYPRRVPWASLLPFRLRGTPAKWNGREVYARQMSLSRGRVGKGEAL